MGVLRSVRWQEEVHDPSSLSQTRELIIRDMHGIGICKSITATLRCVAYDTTPEVSRARSTSSQRSRKNRRRQEEHGPVRKNDRSTAFNEICGRSTHQHLWKLRLRERVSICAVPTCVTFLFLEPSCLFPLRVEAGRTQLQRGQIGGQRIT